MSKRRFWLRRGILILSCILLIGSLAQYFMRPNLVFRFHDVFWFVTEDYKPLGLYGHREVEAVFDYQGPRVSPPPMGLVRQCLTQLRIMPRWQYPPTAFGMVVLSDMQGKELARLPWTGSIESGEARTSIRLQENDTKLYVSWFFPLPPEVDRSQPIRFSTIFSINDLPALPVTVVIPPRNTQRRASATTSTARKQETPVSIPAAE